MADYRDFRFTKAGPVLRGMGLDRLEKPDEALRQLRENGLLTPSPPA